jgi:Family of unknown function (DUF6527)
MTRRAVLYVDKNGVESVVFRCPGCSQHIIPVRRPAAGHGASGSRWGWNGDLDRPTLNPSILTRYGPDGANVCHSFVTDGRIQFLGDCTHALAGQTVDLPAVDADFADFWGRQS